MAWHFFIFVYYIIFIFFLFVVEGNMNNDDCEIPDYLFSLDCYVLFIFAKDFMLMSFKWLANTNMATYNVCYNDVG